MADPEKVVDGAAAVGRRSRKMSKLVTVSLLALVLPACSDETGTGTSSGQGTGGGGPDGTERHGAVNMEVYATAEQTCPAGNVHIDVGNLKSDPPVVAIDGFDGASIACDVVPMGKAFAASGEISVGAVQFGFGDLTTDGTSAIGNASFTDAAGTHYASHTAKPCVFQFAPGTAQAVSAGSLWVQFDCSSLVSDTDATQACSSRYGYLLVENCGK